jgi:hypothetical protein
MATLVPDPQVARDLGVCLRTLSRWDERRAKAEVKAKATVERANYAPAGAATTGTDAAARFPPPIYVNGRKYRDAGLLAEWRRDLVRQAMGFSTAEEPKEGLREASR